MSSPTQVLTHQPQPEPGDWLAWRDWAARQPTLGAFGIEDATFADGRVTASIRSLSTPLNPNGAVHGGLVAAALDQIGALASLTRAPADHGVLTCTLGIEYLRPAILPLTGIGQVQRSSSSLVFTRIELSSRGKVCAAASGTWLPKEYPVGTP